MSGPDSVPRGLLSSAIIAALPGWRLLGDLEPFGWAPDHHLRACLLNPREARVHVVLRRAWEWKSYQVELFLYRQVLRALPVRTARLWAAFHLPEDGSDWMVLGDLGTRWVQPHEPADRAAFLAALGLLHGKGSSALRRFPADHPVPRFAADSPRYDEWRRLLAAASEEELGEGAIALLDPLLVRLSQQPITLLHGDTDFSNALLVEEGVALIDWEKASLGPAALDLGTLVAHLTDEGDLAPYRGAFALASGRDLSAPDLRELFDLADGHDALRWICHCLGQTEAGHDPGPEWRETYFLPRLRRLRALARRV